MHGRIGCRSFHNWAQILWRRWRCGELWLLWIYECGAGWGRGNLHRNRNLSNHIRKLGEITLQHVDGQLLLVETPGQIENLTRQTALDLFFFLCLALGCG
jgi:hypothetical protein